LRSEAWIQNQRAQAEKGLHQAAESDQFGFDHVMTAFDRLSFDGPTCSSAVSLAGCLRPLPRELLIRAADQGTQGLNRLGRGVQEALRSAPDQQECSKVPDSGYFRVEYGFFARSCPGRKRSITVLNRSARCNRDAKRVGLRCGAIPPDSGPQLRTRRTVLDSWVPRRGTRGLVAVF
jgi:hypothetical protein